MMKRLVLAALLAWSAALPAAAGVFNPRTFTLENGMKVVVVSNHRVPVVTHMVWYGVGGADEPPGKSGIAHFLEHLMFKGTPNHPEGEFSATVARLGGQENAFTGHDYTGFHQTIAVEHLETVMALEADRMTNLTLTPEAIEPERKVVLEERRMRVENNPAARLGEQADAALYLNHPYGRPVIGWAHEVEALTLEDILSFYRRWYAPNNATLVVAGDVTLERVRPLAEKYYGPIPRADTPRRVHPSEPPPVAARRVVVADPRVRQPAWARSHLAASLGWGDPALPPVLEVLAEALGGGNTARLFRRLAVERDVAVSVHVSYDANSLGPAEFSVRTSPNPKTDLEDLEKAVEAEIALVIKDGLTEAEIARAKAGLLAEATYARDSLTAGANTLGAALARGYPIASVEDWPDRLRAVTVDQVNAAARALLAEKATVTSLLRPAEAKP
jgi:zinc protease